jgi:hypothetical protein
MTMDGQPDFHIHHKGKYYLSTVEPLNEAARRWTLLCINGVEPNGWWTIHNDYVEDTVKMLQEENFIVEVR